MPSGSTAATRRPDWLTAEQAAAQLGCTVRTLQRRAAAGEIESATRARIGRRPETTYNPRDVDAAAAKPAHLMPPASQGALAIQPQQQPEPLQLLAAMFGQLFGSAQAAAPAAQWLTLTEASSYTRLSERYLRAAIRDGKLPAIRDGRRRKVRRRDLDAL